MRLMTIAALTALCGFVHNVPAAQGDDPLTRAIQTRAAVNWNQAVPATRIYGNTYYVGVGGLSSVLIRTNAGLIVLDGDLPQSVPLIEANVRKLGLRVQDIKFILNSHAHFDHAGGIAALARDSGAVVVASPSGAAALRAGRAAPDDPQAGFADASRADPAVFAPVTTPIREVRDGEILRLAGAAITAHFTPGHTPGSTTWTWRDCENGRCLDIVYADSLNAIAAPGFHYLSDASHADLTLHFRKSIQSVAALPCDILITVHPELAGIPDKLKKAGAGAKVNPFVDARACRNYARDAEAKLDARIREESEPRL